eukprot:3245816-Amphidinium_carterae.1
MACAPQKEIVFGSLWQVIFELQVFKFTKKLKDSPKSLLSNTPFVGGDVRDTYFVIGVGCVGRAIRGDCESLF